MLKKSGSFISAIAILSIIFIAECQNSPVLASETVLAANLRQVEIILPGFDTPQKVIYEIVGEYAIFEGDIILGKVDAQGNLINTALSPQGIVIDTGRWSGGVIPFVINSNVTTAGRANILSAIAHWEEKTPINFVARTSHSDYVEFVRGNSAGACSSHVGRAGGRQEIKLTPSGSCSRGTLIHEIGHAVGLYHEQSREDRDNHVTIIRDNIQSGRGHNFNKHVSNATDVGEYDFGSIMHYGAFDFCKKDRNNACVGPTIVTKPAGIPIGQRSGLSQGDINAVLRIYNIVRHPRLLADVNGDRKKDIVAFGNDGVYVSLSTGSSFTQPTRWVDNYSHNNGRWRVGKHIRLLGDVNGDGKEDVVGFGDAGVYVSLSTGFSFSEPSFVLADYGYSAGSWRIAQHPRVLADVNGDGSQDVVGFADNGVYVALSAGTSFGTATLVRTDYGPDTGWRVNRHPRLLADVNGDGSQDIVGFGDAGVYRSLADGNGGFGEATFVLADYGYDDGWR